jgi:hypothetical protein
MKASGETAICQTEQKENLFVKPNEQKKACFHFAMARKGARKRTIKIDKI